jgi:hypothetical protein
MTKAYEIGGPAAQSALITPIFRAYYEDDLDISDPDVLADAAEQAAIMSKDEVSFLMRYNSGPGRVMVAESNICFLGTGIREIRRVLGQGQPPGS